MGATRTPQQLAFEWKAAEVESSPTVSHELLEALADLLVQSVGREGEGATREVRDENAQADL